MLGGVLGIENSSGVSVISVVSSEEKKCSSGSAIEERVSGSCCIIFSSVEVCAGEASVSVGRLSFIWWSESQGSSFSGGRVSAGPPRPQPHCFSLVNIQFCSCAKFIFSE